MSGFKSINRVPYNARGEALIRAWCQDPINRCLDSGVIDAGLELNESQQAQIMQELGDDGQDAIQAIVSKGYWIGVDLPGRGRSRESRGAECDDPVCVRRRCPESAVRRDHRDLMSRNR